VLGFILIAGEWLIRIGMTPIVVRKRAAAPALSWLAIIYFIPYVGAVLYLLIGEIDLGKRRSQRHATAAEHLRKRLDDRLPQGGTAEHDEQLVARAQRDIVELCRRVGGSPVLGGNAVEPVADTEEFIDRLADDIDAAQSSVHLLYYIIGPSGSVDRALAALERAAKRGVECRVLADGVGSKHFLNHRAPRLRKAGVRVQPCLAVNIFRRALARMDVRNHRKLAVIDGRAAYVGSHNLIEAAYGQTTSHTGAAVRVTREVGGSSGSLPHGPWHDLSARLTGPAVAELQAVFLEDWHAETGETLTGDHLFPEIEPAGSTPIQVAPSGPAGRPAAFRWLAVAALHEADEQVTLTSPYMALDESTLRALQLTAMRGVDVRLVLPEKSNSPLAAAACRACYAELLDAGVRIFLHTKGLLHAKTMTIDDAFTLGGSGNLDMRSFLLNFELNTILYGKTASDRVRAQQEEYLAASRELTLEEWNRRSRWRHTLDRLAMLASPLL